MHQAEIKRRNQYAGVRLMTREKTMVANQYSPTKHGFEAAVGLEALAVFLLARRCRYGYGISRMPAEQKA